MLEELCIVLTMKQLTLTLSRMLAHTHGTHGQPKNGTAGSGGNTQLGLQIRKLVEQLHQGDILKGGRGGGGEGGGGGRAKSTR